MCQWRSSTPSRTSTASFIFHWDGESGWSFRVHTEQDLDLVCETTDQTASPTEYSTCHSSRRLHAGRYHPCSTAISACCGSEDGASSRPLDAYSTASLLTKCDTDKAAGTLMDTESLWISHGSGDSSTWQRPAQQSIWLALKFALRLEASCQNTLLLSIPPCNIFPLHHNNGRWRLKFVNIFRCVLHRCSIKYSYAMILVYKFCIDMQLEQQNISSMRLVQYITRMTYSEFRTSSS